MSLAKLLGKVLVFGVLEMGAMCGVPIRPEEIEQLMKMSDRTEVVAVVRNENGDGDDPPP